MSEGGFFSRLLGGIAVLLRLFVPVLLLLTLSTAVYVYGGVAVPGITDSGPDMGWLTLGFLGLPLIFFAIHLTNRRYGAAYAFGQIFATWAVMLAAIPYLRGELVLLHDGPVPPLRELAAFGIALFIGQAVAAITFDRLRGPRWWQAPFFASVFAGLFFCAVGFPSAYAGTATEWIGPMLTYIGVTFAWAVALLIPYWMLRPMIPPLSGFGGY